MVGLPPLLGVTLTFSHSYGQQGEVSLVASQVEPFADFRKIKISFETLLDGAGYWVILLAGKNISVA